MIKLAINGAAGRMGRRIIALAQNDRDFQVVFGLEKPGHPAVGTRPDDVLITDKTGELARCDCIIDFSAPEATLALVKEAVHVKKCIVIGTTGLSAGEIKDIEQAAKPYR